VSQEGIKAWGFVSGLLLIGAYFLFRFLYLWIMRVVRRDK